MANGLWNRTLRINLSTGICMNEKIPESVSKKLIGGAGLGAYYLMREVPAECKPLDPNNILLFTTGPFQSSKLPGSAKFSIVTRSPLTHGFLDTAAGATFGHLLKKTGFDCLNITGRAQEPQYLYVCDGEATLLPASELWGLDSIESTTILHERHPKAAVAVIGPAGEKEIAFACIYIDGYSAAGRGGAGAVMGSKMLKAVVVEGSDLPEAADPKSLAEKEKSYRKSVGAAAAGLRAEGTIGGLVPGAGAGNLPVKNWSIDGWTEKAKNLGLDTYNEMLQPKLHPCSYCPVACHRSSHTVLPSGKPYVGPAPEYETVALLGSNCLIDDLEQVIHLNDFCNRMGIDTISAGSCASFAIEALERNHTGTYYPAYNLTWGNASGVKSFLEELVNKTGFGGLFSRGIREAQKLFHPDSLHYACHVKGMDVPGHDPRVYYNMSLSYATGNRGACHMRAYSQISTMGALLTEVGIDTSPAPDTLEGAAHVVKVYQDFTAFYNASVLCQFMIWGGFSLQDMVDCMNSITGWNLTVDQTIEAGDRIFTIQRMLNNRYGITSADDTLPQRFFESSTSGGRAGKAPVDFPKALKELYAERGWDPNGTPSPVKISSLGIEQLFKTER